MKYIIAYRKTKYGYDVHVPSFPGCHSQGKTKKEALENIRDAVKTYLEMEKAEMKGIRLEEVEMATA